MTLSTLLIAAGVIFAAFAQVQAGGKSILGWAVILIGAALLLPLIH